MKKILIYMLVTISAALMLLLTGCGEKTETFSTVTDSEIFQEVPLMAGENLEFSEVQEVGGGNFMIWARHTTKSEYDNYLALLEKSGFEKHVDNGEGVEGYIYTSHYLKEDFLVVVSYFTKLKDATITVCEKAELSKHLVYDESEVKKNPADAKTTLTMPELWEAGNSFVFQLKNGHFIINDGGYGQDLPYLLDYLEEKAPNGEKPIVDAWIISHAHSDHMGPFIAASEHPEWCSRIYLEEAYFTEPSKEAYEIVGKNGTTTSLGFYCRTVPSMFKTTKGESAKVYRMREGERYFFNDITMDVIYTPELLSVDEWKTWNATSVVLMYTIEEQKVMITADTDWECQMYMLKMFDDEYLSDLTLYQAPHHGGNVYTEVVSHIKTETVLYPTDMVRRMPNHLLGRKLQNEYLQNERAKESLGWKEGGVVLTFPYHVGEYERLPLTEWKYTKETAARIKRVY